jgi:2-polyprenyl-3-methyl-5-hydroxy-6-metoxy-1,4-benzoquinol methylase
MKHPVREAYDAWHAGLDTEREANAPWHQLVQTHLSLERNLSGKDVLEIGCGRGAFACWLAGQSVHPRRLVALDSSCIAVAKGRALASEKRLKGINWGVGDIQDIPHSDASFDTVVSCETIEHVGDPGRAVAELARVLRPGGRLFLTTPNYFGNMGLYRLYLRFTGRRFTEVGQPINRFTHWPRTLRWVWKAGMGVCKLDGVGHYLILPHRFPIRLYRLDRARGLTRWTALHSLIVAKKPCGL